jgi:hypothetical protein
MMLELRGDTSDDTSHDTSDVKSLKPTVGQVQFFRQRLVGLKMEADKSKAKWFERQQASMWFQQHHQNFSNQRLPSVDPVLMTANRQAPDWVKLTHFESKLARMDTLRKHMAECDIEFSEITARLELGQSSDSDRGEKTFAEYTQRLRDVVQRINAMSAEYDEIDFSLKTSDLAHEDKDLPEEGPAAMACTEVAGSTEVAGIGAILKSNKHSILTFVALHPVGAAALSRQVNEDDRLVAVDGVVVRGMTPKEVALLIRGHVGSEIELELLRPAATQCSIVTLVRQPLVLEALQQEWV